MISSKAGIDPELLQYLNREDLEFVNACLDADGVWAPHPDNEPQQIAYACEADILGYGGAAGGGKGQPLDAPILTPFGFIPMGSLRVGSAVCNPDGSVASVIGIYPLGERQLYRFTFHDGTSCEVTEDHIWLAWRARRSRKDRGERLTGEESARLWTTAQLIEKVSQGHRFRFPVSSAVKFTDTARYPRRPVDPYLLGVLLGDGSITQKALRIACADPEIISRIAQRTKLTFAKYEYAGRVAEYRLPEPNNVRPHLAKWGLVGAGSAEKFIPPSYLLGTEEERQELLRGLMDTDGWADADGDTYYCTISPQLRDDVAQLARSLGALVTIRTKQAKAQNGNGSTAYTLRIKLHAPANIFTLERKRAACAGKTIQSMGRRLVSIVPSRKALAQCIKVSHPNSLYITDDFIVTHNTDLGLGKALNKHQKIAIFRREGPQLLGIRNRLEAILGSRDGYNGKDNVWYDAGPRKVYIEFGSAPHAGDETKHQGRDKDLLIIEEAANFLASQVRFLMGWVRTTDPRQRCQTLLTFNPPTSTEGQWIVDFFAPWLDKKYPDPAEPGELRWAASLPASEKYPNGRDIWLDDGSPFVLIDGQPVFDFDPAEYDKEDVITPKTRTFISARVSDNPYLMGTGYMSTLQALPEPLRSQMLKGDFTAGMQDDPWQLCPTEWVEAAMARWVDHYPKPPMDALGIDVARGGKDNTVIIPKHEGLWFDKPQVHPGSATPNGPKVAGLVVAAARDGANQNIDVIGVGASPYDFLMAAKQPVFGIDVRVKSTATDKSGKLRFFNLRSEIGWKFRELLDPANNTGIMLPPDPRLKADLCAIKWSADGLTIQVESREDTEKRIQRSPDWASAIFLAAIDNPKLSTLMLAIGKPANYDPYADDRMLSSGQKPYDPYANI